jgi:hypothetical protein
MYEAVITSLEAPPVQSQAAVELQVVMKGGEGGTPAAGGEREEGAVRAATREATLMRRVRHPNVVALVEVGRVGGHALKFLCGSERARGKKQGEGAHLFRVHTSSGSLGTTHPPPP